MDKSKLKSAVKKSSLYGGMTAQENDSQVFPTNVPSSQVEMFDLDIIKPSKNQPRRLGKGDLSKESLKSLIDSIKEFGVLEPILVRPKDNGQYEIIAGERRYQASVHAQRDNIPVVVKDVNEQEAFRLAMIENIQREDLSPVNIGICFQYMLDKKICKNLNELAKQIGVSKTRAHQLLGLLKLSEEIQDLVCSRDRFVEGENITEGHARQLLRLQGEEDQMNLLNKILTQSLSVRKTEEIVKILLGDTEKPIKTNDFRLISKYPDWKVKISSDNEELDIHFSYRKGENKAKFIANLKKLLQEFEEETLVE